MSTIGPLPEWPVKLHAKIARATKPNREDVLDVLSQAQRIHAEALRMDARISELEADNLRLKHENEFMLRLLDHPGLRQDN
jgi:hypothetical protein